MDISFTSMRFWPGCPTCQIDQLDRTEPISYEDGDEFCGSPTSLELDDAESADGSVLSLASLRACFFLSLTTHSAWAFSPFWKAPFVFNAAHVFNGRCWVSWCELRKPRRSSSKSPGALEALEALGALEALKASQAWSRL